MMSLTAVASTTVTEGRKSLNFQQMKRLLATYDSARYSCLLAWHWLMIIHLSWRGKLLEVQVCLLYEIPTLKNMLKKTSTLAFREIPVKK